MPQYVRRVNMLKRNGAVWLAVAIPVLVVVAVALSIYVPRLFVHPTTDFVYVVDDTHYTGDSGADYRVVDGRIVEAPTAPSGATTRGRLLRYDVKADRAQPLTLAQAQALTLDPAATSPDGFSVVYTDGSGGGLFSFGGDSGNAAVYLDGRGVRLRLDLPVGRSYESNGFHVVGWIR
jgi:hypothetical protein